MNASSDLAIRAQLARILSAPTFANNDRTSRFLRFVVEQELLGLGDQVKESIVGVEVFGRAASYDVRRDSIVRTEAAKLRDRLTAFYALEGAGEGWIIELPKGGYRPVFRQRALVATVFTQAPGRGYPRWLVTALGGIGIALAAVASWRLAESRAATTIAVLPLLNLSQDPGNEYFSDGLTSEIIRNLSLIEGLTVRSQTSAFALKGTQSAARETGKKLAVDYLLEGSVLRIGQKLRINAQLIRVSDDFPLWSGRYDRELNDIFAIQDEISRGIVNSLRLKLGAGRRRYETSADAYDWYLRARAKQAEPLATGVRGSIEPFVQAIAKDPSFAPAYAGLATSYATLSGFDVGNRPENLRQMREAAATAIQLDPLLAEGHDSLGAVQARDAQWQLAEKSFLRAIELDPNDAKIRKDYAMSLLFPLGRLDEAIEQLRIEAKSDPLSPGAQADLALALRTAGRYAESAKHCLPRSPCLGAALLGEGKIAEGTQILEAHFQGHEDRPGAAMLGVAYATGNHREEASELAAKLPRPLERAMVYAAVQEKERTIGALEEAAALGPIRIGRALVTPEMRFIRDERRVQALRKKVGLPE